MPEPRIRHGVAAALRAPFTAQNARRMLFCLLGVGFGLAVFAVPYALFGLAWLTHLARPAGPQPAATPAFLAGIPATLIIFLLVAPLLGRRLGALHRGLAARLLGERIPAPAPAIRTGGLIRRLRGTLGDGPGWRAICYSLLKLPIGVIEGYGVFCWVVGLVNVTYPFWWRLFRNHPPDVQLSPARVLTPFGPFDVGTFPGTFAALAAGAAMVLAAPWLARAATTLDVAAMRGLLGPGRLALRVQQLQDRRARAIDEAATTLRRLERDLHDGAQIRLATLALNLGMATEKLGEDGPPVDLAQARELLAAARRDARDALVELRDLVRGLHPPVLDDGLPDALATLANSNAIPVTLAIDLPVRPSPGIETIAYFCTTELLTNAAKHSHATQVHVDVRARNGMLTLTVIDDGAGGADPTRGTGLAGLADRVVTVDGTVRFASPPGGPTEVVVELPLQP